jgi:tRNA (guanine-N7-)-methyltransferase
MKRKQERFRIIESRDNVIEPSKPMYLMMKGRWNSSFFMNNNPITVELACGRGEYTVGLAALFPERNFIGVDIKGERIWKGSTVASERGLGNVAFLRGHISLIESFFAENEIDEMWLTFPDPRPRNRDIKRRLTNPRFLEMFKKILKPYGYLRIKTDNPVLYQYTVEEVQHRGDIDHLEFTDDVYTSTLRPECFDIKTRYEEEFSAKGEKIRYIRFRFTP